MRMYVKVERLYLGGRGWNTIPTSYTRHPDFTTAHESREGDTVCQVDPWGMVLRVLLPCMAAVPGCAACAPLAGRHPSSECAWECYVKELHVTQHQPSE